jgi:4-carboxymuconolactone decarboxylase
MSERYRRGIDIAERLAADKVAHFVESGVAEVAPDFARMTIEFAFGDLYARDALDLKSRELIAIAVLAASGRAGPQLRIHVQSAASSGITKAEIVEALMQTALYAGFPTALNALADCHDLLCSDSEKDDPADWATSGTAGAVRCVGAKS